MCLKQFFLLAVYCGKCCFMDLHIKCILFIMNVKIPFFIVIIVTLDSPNITRKEC